MKLNFSILEFLTWSRYLCSWPANPKMLVSVPAFFVWARLFQHFQKLVCVPLPIVMIDNYHFTAPSFWTNRYHNLSFPIFVPSPYRSNWHLKPGSCSSGTSLSTAIAAWSWWLALSFTAISAFLKFGVKAGSLVFATQRKSWPTLRMRRC